jgi:hypothetical protein
MSKKIRVIKHKESFTPKTPEEEVVPPAAPVVESVPDVVVSKRVQIPILQIEEVARGFRQYRPHHLQSILSFCSARGYPVQGTKEQLLEILSHFGW